MATAPCTVSRYEIPCVVCSGMIHPGDRMFCSAQQTVTIKSNDDVGGNGVSGSESEVSAKAINASKKSSVCWGHEACYDPSLPPPPPCRHWKRLGRCPAKELGMCAFEHDEKERGTSVSLNKQRWGGRRHFVRNQHKNSVFRIFLMQTYEMDYLNKTNGVIIDVAAGKGDLSFELLNLSGVRDCVAIDPRPLNLGLVRSKWDKGLFEPKRTGIFAKWYPACEDGSKERTPKTPKHIRCFFGSDSFLDFMNANEESDIEKTNQQLKKEMERAKRIVWTTRGLQHEDGASYNEEDMEPTIEADSAQSREGSESDAVSSSEVNNPTEARDILNRCHLAIGFHPDQAAGEIVEFAIARKIPWCIVPCCVYSDTFSQRKLADGTNVKSYDHLVKWLCEKDPRAKTATLDLEGKNTVVYTLPDI